MNHNRLDRHLLTGKRAAIVGAGPAGLTLARLLQLQGVEVRVFERDADPQARDQGGSLDLHESSGLLAVRRAGLEDEFRKLARPQGQRSKLFAPDGRLLLDMRAEHEAEQRPEIDRIQLRDLFLNALSANTVSWGKQLLRLTPGDDHQHRLVFADGSSAYADLVVGCDGAWSRVRPLLSPIEPLYCGVTFIETRLRDVDTNQPQLAALVGQGNLIVVGSNQALMAQRNGDGSVRVYVALRVPADWAEMCGIDFGRVGQARARLLALFEGWAPHVLALLRFSDNVFLPRPLFTLPADQSWRTVPGLTLLGDAAHVMPPFTGKGANMAMLDAVELADCLAVPATSTLTEALERYERAMLLRMGEAIGDTLASQDLLISPEGAEPAVAAIRASLASVAVIAGTLADKIALITGGSSGIGLAVAELMHAQGATVVIVGRERRKLDDAIARIGPRACAISADVAVVSDIERVMDTVARRHGRIDVLFANAGTSHCPPLRETDEHAFDTLMDLNLKGVFFTCVRAIPLLSENASVILTGSAAADMGRLGDPLYAASKAAVRSLARGFASDPGLIAKKVRVNVLSPGAVKTSLTQAAYEQPEVDAYVRAAIPMQRWGDPAEIARAVMFLASNDSSYMTGSELAVDGGMGQV